MRLTDRERATVIAALRTWQTDTNEEGTTKPLTNAEIDTLIEDKINIASREPTAKEVIRDLFDQLNGPGQKFQNALEEHFNTEHRTLQQCFFRNVIRPIVELMAGQEEKGWIDLRNEGSGRYAKAASAATHDIGMPLI